MEISQSIKENSPQDLLVLTTITDSDDLESVTNSTTNRPSLRFW